MAPSSSEAAPIEVPIFDAGGDALNAKVDMTGRTSSFIAAAARAIALATRTIAALGKRSWPARFEFDRADPSIQKVLTLAGGDVVALPQVGTDSAVNQMVCCELDIRCNRK